MAMPFHLRLGYRGEQLTVRLLRKQGYEILTVNFNTPAGETDIVARARDGTICFVEVKTRSEGAMFPPADAVDEGKQRRLIANAYRFLAYAGISPDECQIRFDIAEVTARDICDATINYIVGAFAQDGI